MTHAWLFICRGLRRPRPPAAAPLPSRASSAGPGGRGPSRRGLSLWTSAGCWAETQSCRCPRSRPPSLCCRPGGCNDTSLCSALGTNHTCQSHPPGLYLLSAAAASSGGGGCSSGNALGQTTSLSHSCSASEVRRRGLSEPGESYRYWREGRDQCMSGCRGGTGP